MVIDRIEGDFAVVEVSKGEFRNVPLSLIEGSARDGSVLNNIESRYIVDEEATLARRQKIQKELHSLFRKK